MLGCRWGRCLSADVGIWRPGSDGGQKQNLPRNPMTFLSAAVREPAEFSGRQLAGFLLFLGILVGVLLGRDPRQSQCPRREASLHLVLVFGPHAGQPFWNAETLQLGSGLKAFWSFHEFVHVAFAESLVVGDEILLNFKASENFRIHLDSVWFRVSLPFFLNIEIPKPIRELKKDDVRIWSTLITTDHLEVGWGNWAFFEQRRGIKSVAWDIARFGSLRRS